MSPSADCVEMVRAAEGFAATAYPDGAYHSIGYGHHGPEVAVGDRITQDEAERLLVVDLETVADKVSRLVRVQVSQNQFDALVSLAYNIGLWALEKSTLLRYLNSGEYGKAASEFKRWNRVRGIPVSGLTARRAKEEALFRKGE